MISESNEEGTDISNRNDVGLEDTEENLGDEEIDFQISDNTSSNSKSPIDESELPMETEFENIEEEISFGEEELANISSSCIDEVSQGRLVVGRERSPLPDGTLRRVIDHSITREVKREDYPRGERVLTVVDAEKRNSRHERPSFEQRCRELNLTREEGLQLLNLPKSERGQCALWETPTEEVSRDNDGESVSSRSLPRIPLGLLSSRVTRAQRNSGIARRTARRSIGSTGREPCGWELLKTTYVKVTQQLRSNCRRTRSTRSS